MSTTYDIISKVIKERRSIFPASYIKKEIPVDLVTASGSGLDPHITVQAAKEQIKRIAKIRGIAEPNLEELILTYTENPLAGLFGPERINVLKLNIALDQLK